MVNILGFSGYTVSVAITATVSHRLYIIKWEWLCFNMTLFTKLGDKPTDCVLLTPYLDSYLPSQILPGP